MLRNYLVIALRSMIRHKAYSLINLFGLAFGMAACIIILLFVQHEMSYDKYLKDHDRIFRISRSWTTADGVETLHLGHLAPPFSPLLKLDYEGTIEQSVRLLNNNTLIGVGTKEFEEEGFFFADPEFLDVFSWSLLHGDRTSALKDPYSIILTKSLAEKYFGSDDAIGQTINFDNEVDLKVTGIIEDIPDDSHFHPTMFAPMILVEEFYGGREQFMNAWGSNNFSTFVRLKEGVDPAEFEAELPNFFNKHFDKPEEGLSSDYNKLSLMNIADIHLHSHLDSEIEQNGDYGYVSLFAIIAFFILTIACVNYVNLATARSAKRSREVGIRKVMGAFRKRLIGQFLTESMIFSVLAVVLAFLVVALLMPWFNNFSQRDLSLSFGDNPFLIYVLIGIALTTGLLAGLYPAIYLSSFQPAAVLKGSLHKNRGTGLRSVLVVFQFFVSIVMMIGVGVVHDQLNFVKTKDLGFTGQQLLVLQSSDEIRSKYQLIKNQLLQQEGIKAVGFSSRIPSGRLLDSQGGSIEVDGDMKNLDFRLADIHTDFDFLETMGIPVIAGRDFNPELSSDSTEAFIINEAAVKAGGWKGNDSAIGKKIFYGGREGYITGVVKDFHFESLKQEIAPMIFMISNGRRGSMVLNIDPLLQEQTISYLQDRWSYLRPGYPFSYYFVDARFDDLYEEDERVAELVSYFSIVAIIIGVLGLFGLASFTTEQRFKEIGVRKVMGASVSQILILLSKGFTGLVLLGFALAIPVAWIAMTYWLDSFAYHASISILSILIAGLIAILIAWLSVSLQTMRAATSNPAHSLRHE